VPAGSAAAASTTGSCWTTDDGDVLISGEDLHIGSHPHPSTAYLYDESLDQWNATVNTPSRDRFSATMTLLPDGRVLFAGGYDNHSTGTTL